LLLDKAGHVLVPLYVPRIAWAQATRMSMAGGGMASAQFVGSDQQTNLSVLKLTEPAGKPIEFSSGAPPEGSLVLFVATDDASARLGIWTAIPRESSVVVGIDGQIAGITRSGQFLSGSACQLIADQLIRHGSVRRATLGIIITQIEKDDPLRKSPSLGERPAVRVNQVIPGSAADLAGMQAGDLILIVAGEPVADIPSLAATIASRDGATEVQVLRGERMITLSVNLQPR
jgi:S1-C subfamily serine protease